MTRLAIVNAQVIPIEGQALPAGSVLIESGRIAAVRAGAAAPAGFEVFDAGGATLLPGLVEAHCHVGLTEEGVGQPGNDGNESIQAVAAQLRALDGINPDDPGFESARRAGVTTLCIAPGSAEVIGGEAVVVKSYPAATVDEMAIRQPAGVKMALGENPKRLGLEQKRSPVTRMAIAALIRQTLCDAQEYQSRRELARRKQRPAGANLGLETLVQLLRRRVPAHIHAHRADDVATALRLAREFRFDLIIQHGTGALPIAGALVERLVPVVFGPLLAARTKVETRDREPAAAVALQRAGVKLALSTDAPVSPIGSLLVAAALAVREGMDEAEALRAVTLTPAEILGVDVRVGSLRPGKDADMVLIDGPPLDARSRVRAVWIEGRLVYGVPPGGPA